MAESIAAGDLMVVASQDQSIYAFRGAAVHTYLTARDALAAHLSHRASREIALSSMAKLAEQKGVEPTGPLPAFLAEHAPAPRWVVHHGP